MLHHVFCLHGLLRDSDQGPKFTSLLEWVLQTSGSHHHPVFGVPSIIQGLDGTHESGDGNGPALPLIPQPLLLFQTIWVEYAYNTLPNSATSLSPFQWYHGYQPPFFPGQKQPASFWSRPSFVAAPGCRQAHSLLLCTSDHYQKSVDRHSIPAPCYTSV